jgi:serine/threonine protein kinase
MAPELLAGAAASERPDEFALGGTFYHMLTGHFPYGETEPFSHPTFGTPTPLTSHRPDLPAFVDRALLRAIAVDPDDRCADVLERMFELEHGTERASPIVVERRPLHARNPLLFWKIVAAMLAVLLVASNLYQAHHRGLTEQNTALSPPAVTSTGRVKNQ